MRRRSHGANGLVANHVANVTNPNKGGLGRVGGSDVRFITTVDHHSSVTLLDDWRTMASPGDAVVPCPHSRGDGSDPSVMLGLVLVLVANTIVVAALVGAMIWILA